MAVGIVHSSSTHLIEWKLNGCVCEIDISLTVALPNPITHPHRQKSFHQPGEETIQSSEALGYSSKPSICEQSFKQRVIV
jgi:hypothetical protein